MIDLTNTLNNSAKQELVRLLSEYFTRRGRFLAQVISADLQNFPSKYNQNGQGHLNSNGHTQYDRNGDFLHNNNSQGNLNSNGHTQYDRNGDLLHNNKWSKDSNGNTQYHNNSYLVNNNVVTPQETIQPNSTNITEALKSSQQITRQQKINVEKLLIDLVVEQTGYSSQSIGLDAKLLEDLNLDSIKAGELIATAAKECGVAGDIDPSSLANANLQEIAAVIRSAMPPEQNTQPSQTTTNQTTTFSSLTLQTQHPDELLSKLDRLSEEEIDFLLSSSLS